MTIKDSDRIIGKLEEFQEWSKKELESVRKDLDLMRQEIAEINKFRWIFYGRAAVMYSVILVGIEFVLHKTLFAGG